MMDLHYEDEGFRFPATITPKLTCYSPYLPYKSTISVSGERLHDADGNLTSIYFFEFDNLYNAFFVEIFLNSTDKKVMTSKPPYVSIPRQFSQYNFYFTSAGYYYSYNRCNWGQVEMSAEQFCSNILSHYDPNASNDLYGPDAYPNIYNSIYRNLTDFVAVESVTCKEGYFAGKTCKSAMEIMKCEFEERLSKS